MFVVVAVAAPCTRRLRQVFTLWIWVGMVSSSFYFLLSHFTYTMHYTEVNKAVMLGSVCTCAIAVASPQVLLWMPVAIAMCHERP